MKPDQPLFLNTQQIKHKLEHYCAYQDRCHKEVEDKLKTLGANMDQKEEIVTYLISNKYIDEERFAKSFARGKHNYKSWGKVRIQYELKYKEISARNIKTALEEIPNAIYIENFNVIAEKNWQTIKETNLIKKQKKLVDFLTRKGFENNLIYEKVNELKKENQ